MTASRSDSCWTFAWSKGRPWGVSRTRHARLPASASSDSIAATSTSTRITMPLPPPYGVSSTLRCLPSPKSRGLRRRTASSPPSIARATKLVARKPANISGKRVTMSTRTDLGSLDSLARGQSHRAGLDVDSRHDGLHQRHLPGATAIPGRHEQDINGRVRTKRGHAAELRSTLDTVVEHHPRPLDVARVELAAAGRREVAAAHAHRGAAELL